MATNDLVLSAAAQKLVCDYVSSCYTAWDAHSMKAYMAAIDRQYARRLDATSESLKAQAASYMHDPTKFRNMIYPIIMPQVETAVSYQSEVFCTGVPLFPVVTPPDHLEAGAMLETVLDAQAQRGAWTTQFTMAFRDGFKYNHCAVVADWSRLQAPRTTNSLQPGQDARKVLWEGNVVKRLDLYNTFYDKRVLPSEISTSGEFAGYIERMPRTRLHLMLEQLPTKLNQNVTAALSSQPLFNRYYTPDLGTSLTRGSASAIIQQDFNWFAHFGIEAVDGRGKSLGKLGDTFEVVTAYIRIRPVDFKFTPNAATLPQVYKVIIVNWCHLVHISAVDTELSELPVFFTQPYEDGLGYATGSLAENVEDIQQLASAYINSAIASRRRSLVDRAIYNPQLIDPRDLESDSPIAKIRMKPSAMADRRSAAEAYYPIPFQDTISGQALQEAQLIKSIGFDVGGQNPAKQGQFVKGNKTRSEFNAIMDFSTGRDRLVAQHFESRLFTPLKRHLKRNVLTNQGPEFLYSRSKRDVVRITPQAMAQAVMEFKIGDGLTPSSKMADLDMLQVMFQTVQAVPALQQEYPIGKVFATMMQAGGVDVTDHRFSEAEIRYNQQVAMWQQAAMQAAQAGAPFNVPMPQPPQAPGAGQGAGTEPA